jgi:Lon protease-like protein
MIELPLFPLNTVLFPGMPLTLHIFEERYKRMMRTCLRTREPFGVVLTRHGVEAFGPLAEPHYIGTTARILETQPLKDGKMNIVALGQKRFRILDLDFSHPYLVGRVELYPLINGDSFRLEKTGRRLRPWVERYMHILTEVNDVELNPDHLPNDPMVLAYLAAVLLQIPPEQKQELLAAERALDLLTDMCQIYRREVPLLRAMLNEDMRETAGSFSMN